MRRIFGIDAALRANGTTSSRLMGPNGPQPNVAPVPFVLGRLLARKRARVNQGALHSLPAQRWAGGLNLVEVVPPPLDKSSLDQNRYQIPNSEELSEHALIAALREFVRNAPRVGPWLLEPKPCTIAALLTPLYPSLLARPVRLQEQQKCLQPFQ
jgi:hypothetical protein